MGTIFNLFYNFVVSSSRMFLMYMTNVLSFFGFTQVSLRIPGKVISAYIKYQKNLSWHFWDDDRVHEQWRSSLQELKVPVICIYSLSTILSLSGFTNYKYLLNSEQKEHRIVWSNLSNSLLFLELCRMAT